MATELDLEIPGEVTALLAEFGRDSTFIVRSKTYSEATGKTTYGAEPNVSRKCTPPWPYGVSFRDGDVATEGDALIYIAAEGLTFTPVVGIEVVIDSRTWMVTKVDRISSGTLDAAWALGIKR